ncbi:MAG TPA: hypothetical protein VHW23_15365 [Kofleriaceae bacterium]|nr:hypothetical protein [Kofleriaceae bacterium]
MTGALRILALHGYHGRGELLRAQLAPLAGALAADAGFVCVDAPALAAGDFGWWHAVPDEHDRSGQAVHYRGWSATCAWLFALLRDDGPFDGVFGFSQGAAVAALLAALCVVERPASDPPALPFAILAGGFASRDARHATLLERAGGIAVPSLHLIGRRDGVVAPRDSHALASRFAAPAVVEHDGGHVIPSTPGVVSAVRQFLAQARARTAATRRRSAPVAAPARVAGCGAPLEVPLWPGRAHPAMQLHHPRAGSGALPVLVVLRGGGYARCDGSGAGSAGRSRSAARTMASTSRSGMVPPRSSTSGQGRRRIWAPWVRGIWLAWASRVGWTSSSPAATRSRPA